MVSSRSKFLDAPWFLVHRWLWTQIETAPVQGSGAVKGWNEQEQDGHTEGGLLYK